MNKYQEALDNLVKHSCPERTSCNECDMKEYCNRIAKGWIDTLQELVDKETPNKVDIDIRNITIYKGTHCICVCPVCSGQIDDFTEIKKYCPTCGQRLDWRDEE